MHQIKNLLCTSCVCFLCNTKISQKPQIRQHHHRFFGVRSFARFVVAPFELIRNNKMTKNGFFFFWLDKIKCVCAFQPLVFFVPLCLIETNVIIEFRVLKSGEDEIVLSLIDFRCCARDWCVFFFWCVFILKIYAVLVEDNFYFAYILLHLPPLFTLLHSNFSGVNLHIYTYHYIVCARAHVCVSNASLNRWRPWTWKIRTLYVTINSHPPLIYFPSHITHILLSYTFNFPCFSSAVHKMHHRNLCNVIPLFSYWFSFDSQTVPVIRISTIHRSSSVLLKSIVYIFLLECVSVFSLLFSVQDLCTIHSISKNFIKEKKKNLWI